MKLVEAWYSNAFWPKLLLPFSWMFRGLSLFRKVYYKTRRPTLKIPIVVVGNITVGGTGKTPLVIALTHYLQSQGKRVGIVSRGYGGKGPFPLLVGPNTTADICGDEPLLMHLKTGAPVCCDPKRLFAAQLLLDSGDVDVIISDDGLQHYALDRQVEFCVIDGKRRFGNGYCLPAGPLREDVKRLKTVNYLVTNGQAQGDEIQMIMKPQALINLKTGKTHKPNYLNGKTVTAVCGIGNPERFVETLASLGADVTLNAFEDHHRFLKADFDHLKGMIVMTEKDAIKCHDFATEDMWVLAVEADLEIPDFIGAL